MKEVSVNICAMYW